MAKKKKPGPRDLNELASDLVRRATGEEEPPPEPEEGKDPAAVELGRRGGKKGGPARAKKLTAQEREDIARKAAEARWGKSPKKSGDL